MLFGAVFTHISVQFCGFGTPLTPPSWVQETFHVQFPVQSSLYRKKKTSRLRGWDVILAQHAQIMSRKPVDQCTPIMGFLLKLIYKLKYIQKNF